jgi:hypothetical protein
MRDRELERSADLVSVLTQAVRAAHSAGQLDLARQLAMLQLDAAKRLVALRDNAPCT